MSWTAPSSNGGSSVTSYTVTPYVNGVAQAQLVTNVGGNPPATSVTVSGLTNGTSYTFTVAATNGVGTGPASAASNAVTPSAPTNPVFVQQTSARTVASSLTLTPTQVVTVGNRLIVQVGVWSASNATTSAVTDSAGNTYTKLVAFTASDHTEMSVWSAPITAGGGTKPTVTVTASGSADIGGSLVEYSGLSTASGTAAVDQSKTATGNTTSAATVASGATAATTAGPELAVGFYADSGFGDSLTAGSGWTQRVNVSPTGDMEFVVEDQIVAAGATPNATFGTGGSTPWLAAAIVFKAAGPSLTAPGAPTGVTATAGNASASVSWSAPSNGGSTITSYTVTPYVGSVAQPTTMVTGTPPVTTATVSGLTNGTSYTFTVTAANSLGTGPASNASNAVIPSSTPQGQWGPLLTWPIVAVHSNLLYNGKLLQWDGWSTPEPTTLYDPAAQTFTTITAPSSIFCAGNVQLPDGRILVAGGYGISTTGNLGLVDTNIFDPASNTWTRVANMNLPRWYPDLVELSDGRYVAISGNSSSASAWADTPEVYDPATNTWTLLSGVSTSQVHEEEYPFSYLAPNGKVFTIGPSEDVSYFLDVNAKTWTPVGSSGIFNGSSVMYRPGKILYSGGAPSVTTTTTAQAATSVIDLTAATPTWTSTAPMNTARVYHTLTMLADGRVLAVGGESTSDQTQVTSGVLPAEIWDPASQTWSTVASMSAARNYHSTAVLMPDGTVLVAGGGHGENNSTSTGQYSAQVYSPSYLFNGPRPTISAAPSSATFGSSMSVSTPDAANITAVNLVSLGTDTHQADMSQHFVPLSFTAGSGSLSVQVPASAATAPAGYYMLFIVNGSGVPSIASIVQLKAVAPTVPGAPSGVSATAGNGSAVVSWSAPSSNGGSSVTSYTVTPYVGGVAQSSLVTNVGGNPPATSVTVSGLTNGTSYTFTVSATNVVGTGPASAASNAVTPTAPTVPGAPTGITATAGSGSASVSWTAPSSNGGSSITSYTVTPYVGGVAQSSLVTNVGGNPPATSATITGLTNGTSYTFTVAATNGVGTGPASAPSNAVTPTAVVNPVFVQQTSARKAGSSLTLAPSLAVTAGDRLIVQVGVWSGSNATTSAVSDSAGNTYTKLVAFTASDHTEMSVWSAPITAGGGTKPTVTVTASGSADIGASLVEYSGLSTASGTGAVDQSKTATGNTSGAATVASGATAATTAGPELGVGFYADSGFGDSLTAGSGWTQRLNVSPTADMEFLVEDQVVAAGATPNATFGTGGGTPWLAAAIVFKHG